VSIFFRQTMVVIRETAKCAGSVHDVFEYVANFATTQDWDPGVDSAKKVSAAEGYGLGTEYTVVTVFRGKKSPMQYRTTVFKENEEVVLEGIGEMVKTIDTIKFRADPSDPARSTLVDYSADIKLLGWKGAFTPLLKPVLKGVGRESIAGLTKACEARANNDNANVKEAAAA